MDCQSCKEARYVPLITHETDMKILERSNRRLCIFLAIVVAALLASWIYFAWYKSRFVCVRTEYSVFQDSSEGGSNYYYGSDFDRKKEVWGIEPWPN